MKKITTVMLVLAVLMMAAVPSLCSAENTGRLALYASVPTTQLNMITAMFTAKYPGIKIDVISARSEELMDRVLSANGHEQGGVILGGGLEAYEAIADHLSAYESPNASALQNSLQGPERRVHPGPDPCQRVCRQHGPCRKSLAFPLMAGSPCSMRN